MSALARLLPLLGVLGYISEARALAGGYTHHGKYFGLPIWMSGGECPNIAAKWAALDWLFPVIVWIEQTLRELFFPDRGPGFQIWMGPPIKPPGASSGRSP